MNLLKPNKISKLIRLVILVGLYLPRLCYGQGLVNLYTIPANMVLAPNEESSFYIMMDNPDNTEVDGVDIYMNFDPLSLEILEVQEVFDWALDLNNQVDDLAGIVAYSGGNLQNAPSSSLTLLKIKVKVKSSALPSTFNFDFDRVSPRQCEVAADGFGILDQSTSLSIQIIEECPEIRILAHSPIIDGVFSAGTSIIMSNNLEILNTAVLHCQNAQIPESLELDPGTELRITPNHCISQGL
ncbi:hypothetical protein [Portibacter lacus]|nr:hypothetical protein [Portibacter lacus]